MAETKKMEEPKNAAVQKIETPRTVTKEPEYTIRELALASKELFGVPKECVFAAFAGKRDKEATIAEAKAAIGKFMKKEVK